MGRYKEIVQMVVDFIDATLRPIYWHDDVPSGFAPEEKAVLRQSSLQTEMHDSITTVSWNILRNYSTAAIRGSLKTIIHKHDPNIILIQEAPVYEDSVFWDESIFSQFNAFFAPSHQVQQQTPYYNFVQTGQLTLSRYPFVKTEVYPLPTVARRSFGGNHIIKRLALYTQVQMTNGRSLGIYNIHLENAVMPGGRKKQLAFLLDIIKKNNDDSVVMAGDFNTFLGAFEGVAPFLSKAGFTKLGTRMRIIPRLDHFFLKGIGGYCKPVAGKGSDHRPFLAKLNLS